MKKNELEKEAYDKLSQWSVQIVSFFCILVLACYNNTFHWLLKISFMNYNLYFSTTSYGSKK
jgi:hypothetical protein